MNHAVPELRQLEVTVPGSGPVSSVVVPLDTVDLQAGSQFRPVEVDTTRRPVREGDDRVLDEIGDPGSAQDPSRFSFGRGLRAGREFCERPSQVPTASPRPRLQLGPQIVDRTAPVLRHSGDQGPDVVELWARQSGVGGRSGDLNPRWTRPSLAHERPERSPDQHPIGRTGPIGRRNEDQHDARHSYPPDLRCTQRRSARQQRACPGECKGGVHPVVLGERVDREVGPRKDAPPPAGRHAVVDGVPRHAPSDRLGSRDHARQAVGMATRQGSGTHSPIVWRAEVFGQLSGRFVNTGAACGRAAGFG